MEMKAVWLPLVMLAAAPLVCRGVHAQGPSAALKIQAVAGHEIGAVTGIGIALRPARDGVALSFDWLKGSATITSCQFVVENCSTRQADVRWLTTAVGYAASLKRSEAWNIGIRPSVGVVHLSDGSESLERPWLMTLASDVEVSHAVPGVPGMQLLVAIGAGLTHSMHGSLGCVDCSVPSYKEGGVNSHVSVGLMYVPRGR